VAALTDIGSRIFSARGFRLENGQMLPVLEFAYETYGSLNAKADNAAPSDKPHMASHADAATGAPILAASMKSLG